MLFSSIKVSSHLLHSSQKKLVLTFESLEPYRSEARWLRVASYPRVDLPYDWPGYHTVKTVMWCPCGWTSQCSTLPRASRWWHPLPTEPFSVSLRLWFQRILFLLNHQLKTSHNFLSSWWFLTWFFSHIIISLMATHLTDVVCLWWLGIAG